MSKPRIAISWNSSCGGCDESIVDLEDRILEVAERVEFVLWPCAMDFKYEDVAALPDGSVTAALINGGIQNTHQESVVRLLRQKSQIVIAFGSCACMGGVPALANLTTRDEIFRVSYLDAPGVDNPGGTLPQTESTVDGCSLELPRMFESLLKLDDVIDVDYYLPGCPPTASMIAAALEALLSGNLPERGAVLAPDIALCNSCARNDSKPEDLEITEIRRIHTIEADPQLCFLAQGVICMGPATRDGCDTPCINGNMPCTGCLGPVGKNDQGAKMIGMLGGILAGQDEKGAEKWREAIPDIPGTFYRYSVAASPLGRKRDE